jgi:hypothetical protein
MCSPPIRILHHLLCPSAPISPCTTSPTTPTTPLLPQKVGKERSSWVYTHECFRRRQVELLLLLRRKTNLAGSQHYVQHLNLPLGSDKGSGEDLGHGQEVEMTIKGVLGKRQSDSMTRNRRFYRPTQQLSKTRNRDNFPTERVNGGGDEPIVKLPSCLPNQVQEAYYEALCRVRRATPQQPPGHDGLQRMMHRYFPSAAVLAHAAESSHTTSESSGSDDGGEASIPMRGNETGKGDSIAVQQDGR